MQKLLATTLLSLAVITAAYAQPKQNSPYSRYGLGDPVTRYFAMQAGQAGQTAAIHDPFHLNIGNPASFAFLRSTAFETGLFAKYSQYTTASSQQNIWSGNLGYLALGFTLKSPINEVLDRDKRKWRYGMGVSLTPHTQVGYQIQSRDTLPQVGDVTSDFQGTGGTYRLAWHGGARRKQTAFGATLGWMFGRSQYENTTIFSDSFPNFQNNFRDDYRINGFVWNLGVQHDFVLSHAENDRDLPTRWITVGLTGNGNQRLSSRADVLRLRSRGKNLSTGAYLDADTIVYQVGAKETLILPASFTLGVQYVKADKFKLGAQFGLETWSNYRNDVRPETLHNTIAVSGGAEWIPEATSYNHYLRRVRYRAGLYYRQDPRTVTGTDLNDYGITLGAGFPLVLPRQQTSFVNAALEVGRLGAQSPIEETYFRITLGFTLNDNSWFFKRRFE